MSNARRNLSAIALPLAAAILNIAVLCLPLITFRESAWPVVDTVTAPILLVLGAWAYAETRAQRCALLYSRDNHPWVQASQGGLTLLTLWAGLLFHRHIEDWQIYQCIGLALVVSGVLLRVLAIKKLRDSFADGVNLTSEHKLVMDGVFRILRHPSEAGTIAITVGATVALAAVAALPVLSLLILSSILRTKAEDESLRRQYGQTFNEYREKVGGLFPRRSLAHQQGGS